MKATCSDLGVKRVKILSNLSAKGVFSSTRFAGDGVEFLCLSDNF